MPIVSQIGRRHWKTRLLIGLMYGLLLAGAVSMVYPFLLMLAGSSKSSVDAADQAIIPSFISDDIALYQKHIEGVFNESLAQMRWAYGAEAATFQKLERPADCNALVSEWRTFLQTEGLPPTMYEIGYWATPQSRGTIAASLRDFKREMEQAYGDDITRLNAAMGTTFSSWNAFFVLPRNGFERRVKTGTRPFDTAVAEFARRQPLENRVYFSVEGFFKEGYLKNQYTRELAAYNRIHGTTFSAWRDLHLARRLPDPDVYSQLERDDWERFVRGILSLAWIRADASAASGYREYLRAKYGEVATFNRRYQTAYAGFEQVPFPSQPPEEGVGLSDWEAYLQGWRDPVTGALIILPAEALSLDTVEFRFRDWLQKSAGKGGDLLNVLPPQQAFHYLAFKANTGALRCEFLTRNFRSVGDTVMRHGRAVMNTAIYCCLSVLCALIFNPLAAYALSRYRPRATYKILLFLMITMAFPPMVTQIPVFLMLRQFRLLNTFAALILPGLVNGYTIFLLKGFFDSLPSELYECAQLDGAGEFRLFWQITMRLSSPILAVTALGAFTAAYTNFMMALLVCQDERMWTIMPWLYQLQTNSGQGVMFASLIMASLPTMLVFVFCQKVIMKGIVVPVEK
ncbi:MAG: carbohydrate ABC transporter permease [bacterium]